jgi:hypothetical protein
MFGGEDGARFATAAIAKLDPAPHAPHLEMMSRTIALTLLFALIGAPAWAQTYVPGQSQARLNQLQAQMQAGQLQQLQRQNTLALTQPDPAVQSQAMVRQQQIQQQVDQNLALQQQMARPQANASGLTSQLQQYGDQIQQLQQTPVPQQRPNR